MKAQRYLLGGVEQLIVKHEGILLTKAAHIIKKLYDEDIVVEEVSLSLSLSLLFYFSLLLPLSLFLSISLFPFSVISQFKTFFKTIQTSAMVNKTKTQVVCFLQ